ncbi:MAG TPA: PA14 domain-containing protein [Tepidisphaeraceae bacterium]|jgi:regulation of enolase protein 1 (concanavalin A-like superfamily)
MLASAVGGVGTGLVGNYFSDLNLTNLVATKVDQTVNFRFGAGVPGGKVDASNFSARWSGKVQAQYSENYTFYTESDEPVRLWVNGQPVIDHWQDHPLTEDSGTLTLSAGEFYDIRLEYSDHVGDATLKLKWSSATTPEQVIPAAQLYDSGGWVSQNWLDEAIGGNLGGWATSDGTSFSVRGGDGTFGIRATDNFHYLHQTLNGDGTIIAKLANDRDDLEWPAEAAVMIRESSNPGSKFVAMTVGSGGAGQIQYRAQNNTLGVSGDGIGSIDARWVKLVRDGSFFKAYLSQTGGEGSWMLAGTTFVDMGRTVEVGLAVVGNDQGALTTTFSNVSVTPTVPLGAGLDQVKDYSLGNVFVDVAKQMRAPQTPGFGAEIAVDSTGWPMADFGSIFITGFINSAHIYNGTYKLSFTGQANVTGWAAGPTTVKNVAYNSSTNTTTADVVISADENNSQWYSGLIFTNTRRTPGSGTGSGVTNIKLIRPGYASNTTQVFTNEYLAHLKQFTTLRFMDFTQTNNNPVSSWSDRAKLTDARQSSEKGVAWEYVIQMANQLKKDIWINIPVNATDDYVQNLAQLLKGSLAPDLTVYFEYSNEVWNGGFQQASDDLNSAIAEVQAGDNRLNDDGINNQYYWMWRRVGKRLKEMSDIFANVYGRSAINRKIRPVLANQFANSEVARQQLEWLDRQYGSPSSYIYGIAGAPYFGAGEAIDHDADATVDQYLTNFQESINWSATVFPTYNSMALRYGLKSLAYEGGPDTFGWGNWQTKKTASLDPRMTQIVVKYLDSWYSQGGGLFNWFQAGPTNYDAGFGTWGLSNAIDSLQTPKILGTITVLNGPKTPLTYGIPVPATWDARATVGSSAPYANSYLKSPGTGNSVDYFVRADKSGNYKLTIRGATSGSNEQLRVTINSTIRNITLKNTGSNTFFLDNNFGNIYLNEGENLIRISSLAESAGWNLESLTVGAPEAPNNPPTVVNPAAAGLVINGKTVNLSALGADDGGEANLTYSWRAVGAVPGQVSWSKNGSNAAKNTQATFPRAGTYTLECLIFDGTSYVTTQTQVTINQIASSVVVSPNPSFVPNSGTQTFSASSYDQFGNWMPNQPSFTWTLDNGSIGSISSNGTYTAPASSTGSATIRASAGGVSGTASVQVQTPRTPENPANVVSGIDYRYFEGLWTSVPAFDSMTPLKTGSLSLIDTSPRNKMDGYGFQYVGYITVPTTGTYTFYTNSDDGSTLYIGNTQVVNNDGLHGGQERSGQVVLAAGTHAFKVNYFENAGGEGLSVSYSGPGISKQLIPGSVLKHLRHAPTVVNPATVIPYPVPGTQAAVSVLGGDDAGESGLVYTWSTTSKPAGAPDPSFSANGNNAAKNSVATFGQAGTYQLLVTISNGFGSVTSGMSVVVNQTPQSLLITPSQDTLALNGFTQISASGLDQFGKPMATMPQLTWSVSSGGGSIDASGIYRAPSYGGRFEIYAHYGNTSASTFVDVMDTAPQVTDGPTVVIDSSGTSAQLHIGATDDGGANNLDIGWYVIDKPDGASDPTFSVNNTNSGDTTMWFDRAGTYSLIVSIYDGLSSVEVPLSVEVVPITKSISVTPTRGTMVAGTGQQFYVSGIDQFGSAMTPPAVTWSAVGGSVTSGGWFVASMASSTGTVTATSGSLSAQATVQITNNAPTVAQAASASPSSGATTTANLSVLGADDGGEGSLKYTWSVASKPTGAADPTFSINGTNGSKNTVVTYSRAGAYTFLVTIFDGAKSATSSVSTSVTQKTTTVVVSPGSTTLINGQTQQFTASAKDQFGVTMVSQPSFRWTLVSSGGVTGTVSSSGLYTAPGSGTPTDVVKATANGIISNPPSGTASITVQAPSQNVFTAETDIGGPAIAGSSSIGGGVYTVRGSGGQIWDPADQFHFVYKPMTGNSTIIARIAGFDNTNDRASIGLMFRENLTSTSNHVMLEISPDETATFFSRFTNGFTTASRVSGGFTAPYYLKLQRVGDFFYGYTSPDGNIWTQFASTNVTMNASYYVGLAVSSTDPALLNTATFDHVSVTSQGSSSLTAGTSAVTASNATTTTATGGSDSTTASTSPANSDVTTVPTTPVVKPPVVRINVPVVKKPKLRRDAVPEVATR